MSQGLVERQYLQDIGDAIRSKNGSTDTYTPAEMAQAISGIHTADEVVLVQKTVNANGQYNPSDDSADGYSGVRANVPNTYSASDEGKVVSNGNLVAQTSKNINTNGTHDTTANNSVVVDIPNSYAPTDEGKVVFGGTLVEQTSQNITINGTYNTTKNNEVVVNIPGGGGVSESNEIPDISDMNDGEVCIVYNLEGTLETKPNVATPVAGIAGQNASNAINCLNYNGTLSNNNKWTTTDRNYNNLWIGADYGEPIVLNAVVVAPRTWGGNRQINTVIMEASNDAENWITIGEAAGKGNDLEENKWYIANFVNNTPYRYYRLRTTVNSRGTVNGSVTFTLIGLGFLYSSSGIKVYKYSYYKVNGLLYRFIIG